MIRIGFDAKRAFLNQAGLGNYSRNTLNALRRYFPEKEYVLFTPERRSPLFPDQEGFEVVAPTLQASRIYASLWRSFLLTRKLGKKRIDLYHGLTNELPSGIHTSGIKKVVTIHDLIFLRYPHYYKPIDRKIYFQKVHYACRVADRIIAVSTQTRKDIIRFLNIDPAKIRVVFQSISPLFFENPKTGPEELRRKYHLPEQYILSVGTLEQRKNQLTLLKAVHEGNLDLSIVLVGKQTRYAAELHAYAARNGMKEKVIMPGQVPDEDLTGLYKNARGMVYISEFEGFGLPVIEAMASGCPVVTSNTSCMPETAAGAALLCDPNNIREIYHAIHSILNNPKGRNQLIEEGKKRALEFTGEKTSAALVSLYEKILTHGK
jgi:glycosyltransferase involved in cell wall biosynthesis